MPAEVALGGVLMAALVLYALGAGADFGGGVWDLLALGPRGERERALIAEAMGPIWEANHVWLILVIVLLFACFPPAFAAIGVALHVPLTLMLVGIVLRGSAFAFRSHDDRSDTMRRRWSRLFAIASVVTPVMLGVCVGAVASGRIRVEPASGRMLSDPVTPWLAPFPFALGLFALAMFAFLAAVYLTVEAREVELQQAFRTRALGAAVVVGALALVCLLLARGGAPRVFQGLTARGWSGGFHALTAVFALGAIVALARRRFVAARALAVFQVACIVAGWGLAQYPFLIHPDVTLANAAAPPRVLRAVLAALAAGAALLFPALAYLFVVFKRSRAPGSPRTSSP